MYGISSLSVPLRGNMLRGLRHSVKKNVSSRFYATSSGAEPFINGTSGAYVEEMWESWKEDPTSVHKVGHNSRSRAELCHIKWQNDIEPCRRWNNNFNKRGGK